MTGRTDPLIAQNRHGGNIESGPRGAGVSVS